MSLIGRWLKAPRPWPTGRCILALGLTALPASCARDLLPEPSVAERVRPDCPPRVSDQYYFPEFALHPSHETLDVMARSLNSALLSAIEAPSLSCGQSSTDAYRLIWLPTNRPYVVIEIMRGDQSRKAEWFAEGVELTRERGTSNWKVMNRSHRRVTDSEVDELRKSLNRAQFWTATAWENSQVDDGSTWVFEGRHESGYRVVTRANPRQHSFIDAGLLFFKMAGLPIEERWYTNER